MAYLVNAYKSCTTNGTWYRNPKTNLEWTKYTTCLKLEVRTFSTVLTCCDSHFISDNDELSPSRFIEKWWSGRKLKINDF